MTLALDLGFNAVLLPGLHRPFHDDALDVSRGVPGCAAFVEVDLSRFPLDHPLVDRHPDAFAIRRDSSALDRIDPRRSQPAVGEARARLRSDDALEVFGDAMTQMADRLSSSGIGGIRLGSPDRVGLPLLRHLAALLDERAIAFVAGPLSDQASARDLASAGVGHLVTSLGWWDFSAAWMVEEVEALRTAAPLLAELRADMPLAEAALATAAVVADGIIVPEAMLGTPGVRAAAREAAARLNGAAGRLGEVRQLTAPGAPLTVVVRGDVPDFRRADGLEGVLINHGHAPQPLPPPGALLQQAGAFGDPTAPDGTPLADSPLAPGEVRPFSARRRETISSRTISEASVEAARDWPRLVVESVTPSVAGGDFPVKRVVGDRVIVEATIFTDGHEQLAAELHWRAADAAEWRSIRMKALPNDIWTAAFDLERLGAYEFMVEGWLDRFGGFRRDFAKKLDARVAQPVDFTEGEALVERAAARVAADRRSTLQAALKSVRAASSDEERAERLLSAELARAMDAADDRPHALRSGVQRVDAERLAARFSSWYELFPRSMTRDKARHGTLADVIDHLPRVRAMGFDTLYFPPIHPIGRTNRKGPNNTLTPEPGDPGSPYAIGSDEGGHDAIHPELGSFEDFDRLVKAAAEHGLEIALDFAIQCAPDHPWLKAHPGWFAWRPDRSMKYAENPPKKYQDIVNVDFYGPDAVPGLWEALRDVVLLWIDHGVKTFRVDNPHTKPLPFWQWMIGEVRAKHPDVIFLSEAFTRPTMMYRLAKVGFSQSYTYFTWRDRKRELMEYITELTTTAPRDFYRPHFFVNTPDINPVFLQTGGRPAHLIRAALAATLSGLFGVYSGFELCDATPLGPGKEEYLDSEKYEVRPRDWNAPGNIVAEIAQLNRLRRAWPHLQTHLNTRFYLAHNDSIIWYGKPAADGSDMIMVMVNMDPRSAQECHFEVPLWEFGLPDDAAIAVEDLVEGHRFDWNGKVQYIRIAPDKPYRIWRIAPKEARP